MQTVQDVVRHDDGRVELRNHDEIATSRLYSEDLASFDSKTFNQAESIGIVKTHGMQSRLFWQLRQQGKIPAGGDDLPLLPAPGQPEG